MRKSLETNQSATPPVTLITVTYNSEDYLEETIQSVISQSYTNIEYIIIDGASTDSTVEVIKKYSDKIDYWITEKDRGIYHAMNKGIRAASGEIIGIINSDDWLETDAVENVVEAASKLKSDEFVVHGKIATYNSEMGGVGERFPKEFPMYYLFSTPFKHPAMFVSKKLYEKIGLYNEKCGLAADYDLMLRVIKENYTAKYIDEVLTNVRLVGISTSGNANASSKELYDIIKQNTGSRFLATVGIVGRKMNNLLSRLK